jgi:hypothetical protein
MTGRDRWTTAQAIVDSRDWTSADGSDHSVGRWHVVYEYTVAGERYIGKFTDFQSGDEEYLGPGDRFEIRFNPRRPTQSYYPELRTQTYFLAVCIGIAIVLAVLMILITIGNVRSAH